MWNMVVCTVVPLAIVLRLLLVVPPPVGATAFQTVSPHRVTVSRDTDTDEALFSNSRRQLQSSDPPSSTPSSTPSSSFTSTAPSSSFIDSAVPSQVPSIQWSTISTTFPSAQLISASPMESSAPSLSPSLISDSPSARATILSASPSESNGPTTRPSAMPSESLSPSQSPSTLQPSQAPSDRPSLSMIPSASPSWAPSFPLPTHPPSLAPSTISPTSLPSYTPTNSLQPSINPSISFQPTQDPFGVDVEASLGNGDNLEIVATCRQSIPVNANDVTAQVFRYEYILNVKNGTDIDLMLLHIEEDIFNGVLQALVNCRFDLVQDFYISGLNSAPNDRATNTCLQDEQLEGSACYNVAGQFSATLFYQEFTLDGNTGQRRRLQPTETQISDPSVVDAFSAALVDLFSIPGWGGEDVVGTTFQGLVNVRPPPPPPPENRTPQIVGGVIGGLAGAALVGYLVVVLVKRQAEENTNQYYQQAMDAVDSEIDDITTVPPQMEESSPPAIIVHELTEQDEIDGPMIITTPDMSSTVKAEEEDRGVEFIGTHANDAILQSLTETERMLEEAKRELGPVAYDDDIRRDYDMENTVDL